jgi:hypothetical protein
MKIDFNDYDLSNFTIKDGLFCGIPAKLIIGEILVKFTQETKIFRSSIWSLDGELLSASFPKFVNFGENPEHFPVPENLDNAVIVDKIDGSTAIFDYVNGQLNVRTRGKFSHYGLTNESDFDYVKEKYPQIQDYLVKYPDYSLLFEITTPNQQICINYGDTVELWLIGAINKTYYTLVPQFLLDKLSAEFNIKRPDNFKFDNLSTLIQEIKDKKDGEGVCLYTNHGQAIHKIKSSRYLMLHRLKSEISSFEKVVDLFLIIGKPTYEDFYKYILEHFDFELAEFGKAHLLKCCDIWNELIVELEELKSWVEPLKSLTRKNAALQIAQHTSLKAEAFVYLDGRDIDDKRIKNLILTKYEK